MSLRSLGPAAELFDDNWSRNRGRGGSGSPASRSGRHYRGAGASLGRSAQMARAATGAKPAVFKAIRNGGCHNRTELARQITYVATKSSYVFDAHGEYDGQRVLTPAQVQEVTQRFTRTWDKARQTKLGHTSHLLLSFPIGTSPEAVRDVTRGVCEQFFQGEGSPFDYLVAVHTDRAHTHAHVVVNRHSVSGELFKMRSGHHYSYDLFREAMVEHGDRFGLKLEATRRLDRGLVAYDTRSVEVQQAREAGHEAVPRPRVGRDLENAQQHVALASSTYRGLATEATAEGFEQVSQALLRASLTLANNGIVLPKREIVMAETQGSFDGLVKEFGRNVEALEERIATAPPAQRPRLERGLTEALASVASLNPLGEDSATLTEAPSTYGVYSRGRIDTSELYRLDDQRVRAAVDTAVEGTGLSASEILARVRVGAHSAALEEHWHSRDVAAVGQQIGNGTARPEAREQALDRLDEVYTRIDTVLQEAGVLREARVAGDERELTQEVAARGDAQGVAVTHPTQRADERAAPLTAEAAVPPRVVPAQEVQADAQAPRMVARDPLVDATAARVRDQDSAEYAFSRAEAAQAQPFREALERQLGADELGRLRQGEATALSRIAPDRLDQQALAKAYLESDAALYDTPAYYRVLDQIAERQVAAMIERERLAEVRAPSQGAPQAGAATSETPQDKSDPLIEITASRVREQGSADYAFEDEAEARTFHAALERQLAPDELARLRQGDETALARVASDPQDRLALAKAYLESDPTTRDTDAHHRVLDRIVDEQTAEYRRTHAHEEDGHSHG